jgi:hypothetical protein
MAADGICGLGGLLSCSEGRSASRQPHRCNHRCCSGGGGDCHTRRVRGGYDLPLASCGDCQLAVGVGVGRRPYSVLRVRPHVLYRGSALRGALTFQPQFG